MGADCCGLCKTRSSASQPLLDGRSRTVVILMKSDREDQWGGKIEFMNPITQWAITELQPNGQLFRKGVRVGYRILKVQEIAEYSEIAPLLLNEENKDEVERLLKNGDRCYITFETNDYLEETPETCCQRYCSGFLWCCVAPAEKHRSIEQERLALRQEAASTLLKKDRKELDYILEKRDWCLWWSQLLQFCAFFSVFLASICSFIATSHFPYKQWFTLASGLVGTLSMALYRFASFCLDKANAYTQDLNQFISRHRLHELGISHYSLATEEGQGNQAQ